VSFFRSWGCLFRRQECLFRFQIIVSQEFWAPSNSLPGILDSKEPWLCGTTTIVVMEEEEQRGECLRSTQELQELILAERDGSRKVRKELRNC
jgi:hypothetical protein